MINQPNAVLMPLEPTREMLEAMREINEMWYNPVNATMMYKELHMYEALVRIAKRGMYEQH